MEINGWDVGNFSGLQKRICLGYKQKGRDIMMERDKYEAIIHNQNVCHLNQDDIYKSFFIDIVPNLNKKYGIVIVVGNMDGSISRGLSNNTSDIDMHVFGFTNNENIACEMWAEKANINNTEYVYDVAPYAIDAVLKSIRDYNKRVRRYPTVFYRSDEERLLYDVNNLHWNIRLYPDGDIFGLLQLLVADSIYINRDKFSYEKYLEMADEFHTIDIMDLQYARAYGNYNNLMNNGQQTILVRKYLYTLYELFFCNWILKYGTRPPAKFEELLKGQNLNEEVIKNIRYILNINLSSTILKQKKQCERIACIVDYVGQSLEMLKETLSKYDVRETFSEILHNTTGHEQKVYYFH